MISLFFKPLKYGGGLFIPPFRTVNISRSAQSVWRFWE